MPKGKIASFMRQTGRRAATFALAASVLFSVALPKAEAFDLGGAIGGMVAARATAKKTSQEIDHFDNEGREEFFGAMKKQYGVNYDSELNQRVDILMAELTKGVGAVDPSIYEKPYNYFINNDKSFNAFCSLGHNISINTGLFDMISSMDEVAVVIGHEMAHGQKDHVKAGFKKKTNLSVITAGISGGSSVGVALATNILANQAKAHNITKPQEKEADALAFEYIIHTKYNPGACAAIWQRVLDKSGSRKSNLIGSIFSPNDHPGNQARRDVYAKTLQEYSGGVVSVADGVVSVSGQTFVTPAALADMTGAERSYFVAGNLAKAYHNALANGQAFPKAWAEGDSLMLGDQTVMTCISGDEAADILAKRLNDIQKMPARKK